MMKQRRGVTLIALVITIIVLLILAGVSIAMLTGDNGILTRANEAEKENLIGKEKEQVKLAIQSLRINKEVNNDLILLTTERLQQKMDIEAGIEKTEVLTAGDEYEILFKETDRYYTIDKYGNIIDVQEIIKDKNPGDITKGKNGEKLDGSEKHPYEIWNIEDLVVLSNMTNGQGVKIENGSITKISSTNNFSEKYIELKRNLNFKSKLSYENSNRTDFGDINGNEEDGNVLIKEMETGNGFNPIAKDNFGIAFKGNFEGNNFEIKNIYIVGTNYAGVFGIVESAKISNLGIDGKITGQVKGIGGLIGLTISNKELKTKIENCYNKAEVKGILKENYTGTGGLIGKVEGNTDIINCYNEGNISSEQSDKAIQGGGGIVGYIRGSNANLNIFNSYNIGNISSNKKESSGIVGGIWAEGSLNMENVFNAGISDKAILGSKGTQNVTGKSLYYLDNIKDEGAQEAEIISKEQLCSKDFVNKLNDYINKENKFTWKKWIFRENKYPTFE